MQRRLIFIDHDLQLRMFFELWRQRRRNRLKQIKGEESYAQCRTHILHIGKDNKLNLYVLQVITE